MKYLLSSIVLTGILLSHSDVSYSGRIEYGDEINVKLAKNRAFLRSIRNRDLGDYHKTSPTEHVKEGLDDAGCGQVDIGNTPASKFGGPRKIDIIITGDVINANNNCK